MPPNEQEVDVILQSLLVPHFPPNRSQWRKLELALKFIQKSKTSAAVVRNNETVKESGNNNKEASDESTMIYEQRHCIDDCSPNDAYQSMDLNNIQAISPLEKKRLGLKKQNSWTKMKKTMKHIV